MWKYITTRIIKRNVKRNDKRRKKRFVPFAEARSVLVFAESQGAQQIMPRLQALAADGKKVTLYHCMLASQPSGITFPNMDTVELTLSDFCWGLSRPKARVCRDFLALEPEVVIDLTVSDLLPVSYLLSVSQAPMHLGRKKENLTPADIMIQQNADSLTPDSLLQNLLFYWQNIAAKNNNS